MIRVGIVGAGPAGAYCAYKLADRHIYPSVFDFSHPREKPCGGLVSVAAQEYFPFLNTLPIPHSQRSTLTMILPNGRKLTIRYRKGKILSFSRLKFDRYLVNMALNNGANLIEEKVIGLEHKFGYWKIRTQKQSYTVKTLVGADGINSIVRKNIIGSLSKSDKGLCYGYLVKGLENENITIKFLPTKKGYIWIIPRGEDTSIGIGNTEICRHQELKNELDAFINKFYPHAKKISAWTALIPNVKDGKTLRSQIAGPNWILIGDAAGHVNSITGSGIIYALLDGELSAELILKGHPELFNKLWIEEYGHTLLRAAMLRDWVYKRPILELYCIYLKLQSETPFI